MALNDKQKQEMDSEQKTLKTELGNYKTYHEN